LTHIVTRRLHRHGLTDIAGVLAESIMGRSQLTTMPFTVVASKIGN
jgi:hypothetical protein